MSDILNISSLYKSKKVKLKEILRRKVLIESYFNNINSSFKEYRHLIITKLDSINVDPIKLFYLIRASGNFEIIIDRFLLNYLEEDTSKKRYLEFRDKAYMINKSLLGLYYSYLAKNSTVYSKCFRFYQLAENNYQNVVDYCKITNLENYDPHLYKTCKFYSILVNFTIIIKNILDNNPKLFSEKLEDLLHELEKIYKNDIHIYNLYKQIEDIIQLERDTCIILENIRIDDPFLLTEPFNEEQIVTTDENLNELNRVRNWINNLSEKYQKYQNSLLKLHSGRIIKYLGSYREEFITYKNKNAEKFDDLLGVMINKALETYNEALKFFSDNPILWKALGSLYLSLNQNMKAIQCYGNIDSIKKNPNDPSNWEKLAFDYMENYDFDKAIVILEHALSIDSNNVSLWNDIALCYDNIFQTEKAIDAYKQAINMKPESETLWKNLGFSYFMNHEYENAINAANEALDLYPIFKPACILLCVIYIQLNQYDKAIEACKKALDVDKDYLLAKAYLGLCYCYIWKYSKAIEYISQFKDFNRKNARIWLIISLIFLETNNYDKALEKCKKVLDIYPKAPDVLTTLSNIYYKKGQYENAIKSFQQALQINPKYLPAMASLSGTYNIIGKFDMAINLCKKASKINAKSSGSTNPSNCSG